MSWASSQCTSSPSHIEVVWVDILTCTYPHDVPIPSTWAFQDQSNFYILCLHRLHYLACLKCLSLKATLELHLQFWGNHLTKCHETLPHLCLNTSVIFKWQIHIFILLASWMRFYALWCMGDERGDFQCSYYYNWAHTAYYADIFTYFESHYLDENFDILKYTYGCILAEKNDVLSRFSLSVQQVSRQSHVTCHSEPFCKRL